MSSNAAMIWKSGTNVSPQYWRNPAAFKTVHL